jgi:DNA-binding MarR family transcriptional regulator
VSTERRDGEHHTGKDDDHVSTRYLSEPGPLGLFTRLTRVGLLVEAFQHQCFDRYGLRFIDYSVLRVLQLAGAPYRLSPTELGEIVVRSSGGMTQIVDRLQKVGLVERTPDPDDRRRVVVALTRKGLRTAERANASYARARERLLAPLEPDEIDDIDAAVRRLLEVLTGTEPGDEAAAAEAS